MFSNFSEETWGFHVHCFKVLGLKLRSRLLFQWLNQNSYWLRSPKRTPWKGKGTKAFFFTNKRHPLWGNCILLLEHFKEHQGTPRQSPGATLFSNRPTALLHKSHQLYLWSLLRIFVMIWPSLLGARKHIQYWQVLLKRNQTGVPFNLCLDHHKWHHYTLLGDLGGRIAATLYIITNTI